MFFLPLHNTLPSQYLDFTMKNNLADCMWTFQHFQCMKNGKIVKITILNLFNCQHTSPSQA